MAKSVLTGADAEEFTRLKAELPNAEARSRAALLKFGMESREFAEADAAEGKIKRRIKTLLGDDGSNWMA